MKNIIGYCFIAFAMGIAFSGIFGRWLQIDWLVYWQKGDPGIAVSTACALISFGVGVVILTWNRKPNEKQKA